MAAHSALLAVPLPTAFTSPLALTVATLLYPTYPFNHAINLLRRHHKLSVFPY